MASKVWNEVYGLAGGTDTRVRIPMGATDEGIGADGTQQVADHFAQVVDAVPGSLDAAGLNALADAKPMLQIEFRSKQTNGATVRQKATGESAKARIAGMVRNVQAAPAPLPTPTAPPVASERIVSEPANGRLQPV